LRFRLVAEEIEYLNIIRNEHTSGPTVFKHVRVVKIPIQSAQSVSLADDSGVDDGVIVRVRHDDSRRRPGKDHLADLLRSEVAQILRDFVFAQSRDLADTVVGEHAFQFLEEKWREQQSVPRRPDDEQKQFPRWTSSPAICTDKDVRVVCLGEIRGRFSLAAMPCVFDCFIDCGVDFVFRNVLDLFGATVEECFESSSNAGAAFGRKNLLRGKSGHADLLVRSNRAAQQLFHGRPYGLRQIAGFLY